MIDDPTIGQIATSFGWPKVCVSGLTAAPAAGMERRRVEVTSTVNPHLLTDQQAFTFALDLMVAKLARIDGPVDVDLVLIGNMNDPLRWTVKDGAVVGVEPSAMHADPFASR